MDIPYADFYLLPLPRRRLAAYRRIALLARKVFLRHGALEYREYAGEDLRPGFGGVPFPSAALAQRGETVVAAIVGFKSRAHRDRVMKRVMADPAMCDPAMGPMPFDPARIVYGGFTRFA